MVKYNTISPETQEEAMAIAKSTQRPGQTKEQTQLIALGIQKGIAEYKKSAKSKLRQADKAKKIKRTQQQESVDSLDNNDAPLAQSQNAKLPWGLLIMSWALFTLYLITQG